MAHADRQTMISFARNAEDVVLERVFANVDEGFYIDVGASHPVDDSVTFHFYERGWRGVNTDPDPDQFELLVAARRRDVNLEVAVGSGEEPRGLGSSPVREHSTVDPALAAARGNARPIEAPHVSLARIFDDYAAAEKVEFLKVDAQGSEADVLASADWTRHRPIVVVMESGGATFGEWEPALLSAGYAFALFDGLSRFYCRVEDTDRLLGLLGAPANVLDNWRSVREVELHAKLLADLDAIEAQRAETRVALERERAALTAERKAHADAHRELGAERGAHDKTRRELASVYDSTSWRITTPVRDASRLARMMRQGVT
jgi:FkbM family methyltransferase